MLFWIFAGALTLAVSLAAIWPLLRRESNAVAVRAAHDLSVYQAQLSELDGDVQRGAIGKAEAETARAEIARRLLKAGREAEAAATMPTASRSTLAGIALIGLVFAGAVGVYLAFGSPRAGDMPLAARETEPGQNDMPALIAAVEARLAANPNEGQGWEVLAPVYLRIGDAPKALQAYRKAIELLGPSAERWTGLGEAQVMAAEGRVTEEAANSFRQALLMQPDALLPRFFLALGLSQNASHAEAVSAWEEVIAGSPENAPWLPMARAALEDAQAQLGGKGAPPSAEAVAEMANLSPEQRQERIGAMVEGLAERLKAQPDDIEGWKRLIRAYSVLGDRPAASKAANDAASHFPAGSSGRVELAGLARELGIPAEWAGEENAQ